MYTFAKEPEGIGRILDSGFRLCFAGYRPILKLIGIMLLLFVVLFVGFGTVYGREVFLTIDAFQRMPAPSSGLGIYLAFVLFTVFLSLLYSNAIILKYGAVGKGEDLSISRCLRRGAYKMVHIIVYMFWYVCIISVSSLPMLALLWAFHPGTVLTIIFIAIGIIPPVIFMISLILGTYAIILDDTGIFAAIKRSHTLIWGHWWRTFVYTVIVSMIFMTLLVTIQLVLELGSQLLRQSNPADSPLIVAASLLINQAASLFFMPFMSALTITYYHDLKLRKEGGDLAARIEAA